MAECAGGVVAGVACVYCFLSRSKNSEKVPAKMKRLVLAEPNEDLDKVKIVVEEVDVPVPKSGEILVKMVAAPVNPSDFGSWKTGKPGRGIGKEGCGVVMASGGGVHAGMLVGKKVGCGNDTGTYQQYICVDAMRGAFTLDQSVPTEDGASFLVNPFTVMGIIETAKKDGEKVLIHTAAASQLGQMMVRVAPRLGVTIVCLVRRQEQADILKNLGAQYVVVEKEGWQKELGELVKTLKIKVAFDATAGDMTGTLLDLLLPGGICYVYGGLSEQPVGNIKPVNLIYNNKQVKGWFLTNWMTAGGGIKTLLRLRSASAVVMPGLAKGGWAASQFVDVSMEEMWTKFASMRADRGSGGFTNQKLRIRF